MNKNIYRIKVRWKIGLVLIALIIGIGASFYSNHLVHELRKQERQKVALWAEATQKIASVEDFSTDLSFLFQVINNNKTVPVILTDEQGNINAHRNLDSAKVKRPEYLEKQKELMASQHDPITIKFEGGTNYIYYRDSKILSMLKYYPLAMLGIIGAYLLVAYAIFSSTRRAEQNRVWAGMAKETAHQIGTPLSSLIGWIEILKGLDVPDEYLKEMLLDIDRLEKITQRFSKIGSEPEISDHNLIRVTEKSMKYIQDRSSKKVKFSFHVADDLKELRVPLNISLFEWVVENLLKNSIDAMGGEGELNVSITPIKNWVYVDVSDTGKGIKSSLWRTVFQPGYTSKKRGWGLGLSLAYRIISDYHKGSIFVKESAPDKGTTIRMKLPLA